MCQGVVVMEGENKADMSDNSEPGGVAPESHSEEAEVVEEYATIEASEAEVDKEESLVAEGKNFSGLEEVVTDAREGSADTGDEQLLCVKDIVAGKARETLAEATRVDSTLATARTLANQIAEGYHWVEGLLFRTRLDTLGENVEQLCLPTQVHVISP